MDPTELYEITRKRMRTVAFKEDWTDEFWQQLLAEAMIQAGSHRDLAAALQLDELLVIDWTTDAQSRPSRDARERLLKFMFDINPSPRIASAVVDPCRLDEAAYAARAQEIRDRMAGKAVAGTVFYCGCCGRSNVHENEHKQLFMDRTFRVEPDANPHTGEAWSAVCADCASAIAAVRRLRAGGINSSCVAGYVEFHEEIAARRQPDYGSKRWEEFNRNRARTIYRSFSGGGRHRFYIHGPVE